MGGMKMKSTMTSNLKIAFLFVQFWILKNKSRMVVNKIDLHPTLQKFYVIKTTSQRLCSS